MKSTALALTARSPMPATLTIASGRHHTAETILKAWYESKSAHTIRSYQHDLETFARYLSRALGITPPMLTVPQALDRLFNESAPSAHEIVLGFRGHLLAVNMAPASINRHIACLRSVTKLGRMLGCMPWFIEVAGVKGEKRRQTAGPTLAEVRQLLETTAGDDEAETRAYAIILMFVCCGLRVSELCWLNREELDLTRGTVWIRGKGRREKELIPVPAPVIAAIRRYLPHRGGTAKGPLFLTRSGRISASGDHRLQTRSVLRIVRDLGQAIGIHLSCHGLRHTAVTTAIEFGQKAGIGLDQIRHFSRHKSLATMLIYRDEYDRAAVQKTLADVVADSLTGGL